MYQLSRERGEKKSVFNTQEVIAGVRRHNVRDRKLVRSSVSTGELFCSEWLAACSGRDITQTIPRRSKLKVFHLVIACSWQLPCPGQDNGSGCMNPSLGKHQWQLWCQLRTVQVYDSIWRRVNQHCQTILRGILFNFCLIKGSLSGKLPRYGVLRSPEITTTNHYHHKSPPPQITNTTATTTTNYRYHESPPQSTTTTNASPSSIFGGQLAGNASSLEEV